MDGSNLIPAEEFFTDRKTTCCFTGHRSRDLPFGGDISRQGVRNLISTIQLACTQAYSDGYRTFITGMAEGVDLMCGSVIMDMMNSKGHADIRLVCALPYREQRREISQPTDRYIHSLLMKKASAVVVTGNAGDRGRYRVRNQFMVEHSSAIIAVYRSKQSGSGTLQTINMAKREGLFAHVIDLDGNPQFYID